MQQGLQIIHGSYTIIGCLVVWWPRLSVEKWSKVPRLLLTDSAANGTPLTSTESIKISPLTATDPNPHRTVLNLFSNPVGTRPTASANQLRGARPASHPPTPAVHGPYRNSSP